MPKAKADIRSLARAHTSTALKTLASIMTMTDAPHAARVSAAQALLDRGWGKPKQEVEMSGEVSISGILDRIDATQRIPDEPRAESNRTLQ